jgi:hypothetical protein
VSAEMRMQPNEISDAFRSLFGILMVFIVSPFLLVYAAEKYVTAQAYERKPRN